MKLKRILCMVMMVAVILGTVQPAAAGLGSQTFGQVDFSDDVSTRAEMEIAETEFSDPGLLPSHPLYFLKRWGEWLQLTVAPPEAKAALHLSFARTRLAETLAEQPAAEMLTAFHEEINASLLVNDTDVKERRELLKKSEAVLERVRERGKIVIERPSQQNEQAIASVPPTRPERAMKNGNGNVPVAPVNGTTTVPAAEPTAPEPAEVTGLPEAVEGNVPTVPATADITTG